MVAASELCALCGEGEGEGPPQLCPLHCAAPKTDISPSLTVYLLLDVQPSQS